MDLGAIRNEYGAGAIADLPDEPHRAMEQWLAEALNSEAEATAFSLATHEAASGLSIRVVLAKSITAAGVIFYTNGLSLKGRQIAQLPDAAGVFFWPKLQRQIRFSGTVTRVGDSEADTYFASRPRPSQIAAVISKQSEPISEYGMLVAEFERAQKEFAGKDVPRPAHWGGYCIALEKIEFWQGQRSRLHQRLFFERNADGSYSRTWLQP